MQNRLEDVDHGLLENRWGSFEAKRKDCPLKMSVWDAKGSFVTLRGFNA